LSPTDFSDRGERAIRRAASLASECSAELIVAHVVESNQPEHLARAVEVLATDELEAAVRSIASTYKVACSARVVSGFAGDAIVQLARDTAADLVVMGTHRKDLLKDVLVGTTLERVVRSQSAPVLVANTDTPARHASVLAAVDFSECSGDALETASGLGLLTGRKVTIVHISDPSDAVERGSSEPDIAAQIATGTLTASQALTRFLDTLDLRHLEYTARIRPEDGPPAPGIKAIAAELGADLVVVGKRGRNRAIRTLLGSVTDELLRTLAVDILVVQCRPAKATIPLLTS
jgi:nucleotide-binding universal stress UspA family protein